jgi:hypothetical protein
MGERRFRLRRDCGRRVPQAPKGQGQGYQPDGAGSYENTNHVPGVSTRRQTVSGRSGYSVRDGEHLPADRLQTHSRAKQPGRHALDDAPFPDGSGIEAGSCCKPAGAFVRIGLAELERVLAHDDPQVVFGLGEQAVRVDELESVRRFQRIPLVDVTVDEDGPFVAMGIDATLCTREGVVDGSLGARVIELLPGRRDEVGEPATLLGAGWQTAAGCGPPDARRCCTQDLVPSLDR